jgi:hypothetical protein
VTVLVGIGVNEEAYREIIGVIERAKEEKISQGEIETEYVGYLGAQDTYYVGNIKGMGRIYQQTFINIYSSVAMVKVYTSKLPINSADFLNDRGIPFFDENDVHLLRILTDHGTELNTAVIPLHMGTNCSLPSMILTIPGQRQSTNRHERGSTSGSLRQFRMSSTASHSGERSISH